MEKQLNETTAAQHYLSKLNTCTQEHNTFNKDTDIPKNTQRERRISSDKEGMRLEKKEKYKTRKGLCTGRSGTPNWGMLIQPQHQKV